MLKQVLYTAQVNSIGARTGRVESSDGNLRLQLSVPPSMGGPGGTGTNPEQLFAAAYAACFGGAVQYIASQKSMDIGEVKTVAQVSVGPGVDKEGFELAVVLDITIPKLTRKEVAALVDEAHRICPYSNATRGNIEVKLNAHGGKRPRPA